MWRLWLSGKLGLSEFDDISLDQADLAYRALMEWESAESRAAKRTRK